MDSKKCNHTSTFEVSVQAYTGSVARSAEWENRAAHGAICVTIECAHCGMQRKENRNVGVEVGPWRLNPKQEQEKKNIDRQNACEALEALQKEEEEAKIKGGMVYQEFFNRHPQLWLEIQKLEELCR